MPLETDLLIIGAGSAALVTALTARRRRVCLLVPEDLADSDTASARAQGGLAAAVGPDDRPALHLQDTLEAGCRLNHLPAARLVCREAPSAVAYLDALGVGFERTEQGWALHKEAAHSRARVLHAGGDATGAAIMQALRRHVLESSHIEVLAGARAVALLRTGSAVGGAVAVRSDGQVLSLRARDTVIATGGIGGLYSRSTNPLDACGDGPAMALAAGARCAALEFVQFHPTALDVEVRPLPLMTEALRGAGARIVDEDGARIMEGVHPLGDLAPRDVVARAIYAARHAGRHVRLDATALADADIASAFPSAYRTCRAHGIDPCHEPIPVTPAAHYHMGGIAVDLQGRSSLAGLWAVGEAACTGLHGANRLASNSLLEAVVFGRRVGRALNAADRRDTSGGGRAPLSRAIEADAATCEEGIATSGDPALSIQRELRDLMWECMGVVRDGVRIAQGLAALASLRERTPTTAWLQRSRLLLAEHMLHAAARRRTSCGAHYRSDDALRLSA